jgi:hypothetical protein
VSSLHRIGLYHLYYIQEEDGIPTTNENERNIPAYEVKCEFKTKVMFLNKLRNIDDESELSIEDEANAPLKYNDIIQKK